MTSTALRKGLPATLLVFMAGFALHAKAGNIVLDGGFESPVPNPYTGAIGDGWFTADTIEIDAASIFGASHSGNQMAYLDAGVPPETNTLSQMLATVVGQSYLVSYWVAADGGDALSVMFGSQQLFSGNATPNGVLQPSNYVNSTFTVTATSTSTILSFTGEYTAGGVGTFLDDVSVTAVSSSVPEPASIGLTSLAGATLFALRSALRNRWNSRRH